MELMHYFAFRSVNTDATAAAVMLKRDCSDVQGSFSGSKLVIVKVAVQSFSWDLLGPLLDENQHNKLT